MVKPFKSRVLEFRAPLFFIFFLVVIAQSFLGCSSSSKRSSFEESGDMGPGGLDHQYSIREAGTSETKNCDDLGVVLGTSSYGGIMAKEIALSKARQKAKDRAQDLGASHIVWEKQQANVVGGEVTGRIFVCPGIGKIQK